LGTESVSVIQRDLARMELEFTHVFHHRVLLLKIQLSGSWVLLSWGGNKNWESQCFRSIILT